MIKVVFSKQADHDIDLVPFWYHWYKNIFRADIIIITPVKLPSSSIEQVTEYYREKCVLFHPIELDFWDMKKVWKIQRDIVSNYTKYTLDYVALSADTDQFFEPPDALEIKSQLIIYECVDFMTDSIPSISNIKKLKLREFLPDRNSTLVPKKDFKAAYANTLWHKDVFPAGHYIGKLKWISQQNANLYQFHLPLKGLDQFIKKIESLNFDRLDGSVSWHFKRWVRILNQDGIEGLTNEYHRMLEDKHTGISAHSQRFNNLANKAVIPKDFSWDKVNKEIVEAQQWAHDNHLEEAREKLSGILEIVPFHCFVLLELGRIAWAGKDAILAEKYFNQALGVNPFNMDTIKALGLLLLATNQTAPAIAEFEKGLKIDNKDPELWQWLGKCYMESNDFDKARLAYERSINYATA